MPQFILSDSELARIYAQLISLEQQVCSLKELCSPECSTSALEACLDIDIDKVLVLGGVDVETTTYYVDTVGTSDIQAVRLTVSLGTRSPFDVSFRLIAAVGGGDVVLVDSLVQAGYLHAIVDIALIEAGSVLSLETIVNTECPPQGLKVNLCGVSCGDVLNDGTCDTPPIHCSVFQLGSTTHCSLFPDI